MCLRFNSHVGILFLDYFSRKCINIITFTPTLFALFAEKVVTTRIFGALKSIEKRTCIKFIKVSKLALLNTSVSHKFGVAFSSLGNRYVFCNVKCLRERFQKSRDHHSLVYRVFQLYWRK